jgi:hypothetical protein
MRRYEKDEVYADGLALGSLLSSRNAQHTELGRAAITNWKAWMSGPFCEGQYSRHIFQ